MRVDGKRFNSAKRSLTIRGVLFSLAALIVGPIAFFFAVIGVFAFYAASEYPIANSVLILVLGGFVPGGGAILLGWRAWTNWMRLAHLRQFVGILGSAQTLALDDIAAAMRLTPSAVEHVVLDAVRSGVLTTRDLMFLGSASKSSQAQTWATKVSSIPSPAIASPPAMPMGGIFAPPARMAPTPLRPAAEAASIHSWVGRTVRNTYHVEALIGQGGMGAVFRSRHVRTGRAYALKILLPEAQSSADAFRRFEREATAASALGHQGIIAVHEFDVAEDGTAFLVMDYLEGESLHQRLARVGVLPWAQARQISLEVGDALATAHEAGLLHRDLKPANVILAKGNREERAVLVDFGLVKRLEDESGSRLTRSGTLVGTPLYMSPEQARGEALDVRSDLYGLAVVAFEMITGVPPFFDTTLAAVFARLLREPAPSAIHIAPQTCPPALDPVLRKALSTRREDRYESVRVFLASLAAVPANRTTFIPP